MLLSSRFSLRHFLALLTFLLLGARPGWSQILIVDQTGEGDHSTIQAAIDVAVDGSLILVRSGNYAGFTLQDKAISIQASGESVVVEGNVVISGLGAGRSLVVKDLELRQPQWWNPVLRIESCEGHVRVYGCRVLGRQTVDSDDRERVVQITDSDSVALIGGEIRGGDGGDIWKYGFRGSDGLHLVRSTVALHGVEVRAGAGGGSLSLCGTGGPGGDGIWSSTPSTLYGSGSLVAAGPGGTADCGPGPNGAAVLLGGSGSMFWRLDCTTLGSSWPQQLLPHSARVLEASAGSLVSETAYVTIHGEAGDEVRLLPSRGLDTRFLLGALAGFLLVDASYAPVLAVGVLPPSGSLTLPVRMPKDEVEREWAVLHLQAIVRTPRGEGVASNPIFLARVGLAFIDCDGNGVHDEDDLRAYAVESPWLGPIGAGSPQSFTVSSPPPAAWTARIELQASADLHAQHQRLGLHLNGEFLGWLFRMGASACPAEPDREELLLPLEDFLRLVGDGDAHFEVVASDSVDPGACSPSGSRVRIRWSYYSTEILNDCNGDGIPDQCQMEDCNGNGIPDVCDIASGTSTDVDQNLVPDDCQLFPRYYVDASQDGFADGGSWATAHRDLQRVLALVIHHQLPSAEIWMAQGVYRPDQGTLNRNRRFLVPAGARVYGGFQGGETLLQEREPGRYPTVLSGDLLGNDGWNFTFRSDNSYRVVELGEGHGGLLDGLTITGGHAVFSPSSVDGGAVLVRGPGKVIENCTFVLNHAQGRGGAIYSEFLTAVIGCRFQNNRANSTGAALHTANGVWVHSTLFHGNFVETFGGEAAVYAGGALLSACRFVENRSSGSTAAGALLLTGNPSTLINCLFHHNQASRGAAISVANSHPSHPIEIHNCTITANQATVAGGGIFLRPTAGPVAISNSIIWGNLDATGATESAQIHNLGGGTTTVAYTQLQGLRDFPGSGNQDTDPLFLDPLGPDGIAGTLDDDYRLQAGSPCVDSGWKALLPEDLYDLDGDGTWWEPWPEDFLGLPRTVDDPSTPDTGPGTSPHLDRGAFERQAGG